MVAHLTFSTDSNTSYPTLFIDRDGVLIFDRHYLANPDGVALIPGVCAGLLQAREAGFKLIGISNQSGIGRGIFSPGDFRKVMTRMEELLKDAGASLDGFYYCPHAPEDNCTCRKPSAGLLTEARGDFNWDKTESWVIGDKLSDVQLARFNGLSGLLVATGHGAEQRTMVENEFGHDPRVGFAADLQSAIALILGGTSQEDDS